MVVFNSGITAIAASRGSPSACEVHARYSGNHTSGLLYLCSLGLLRTRLWVYPQAQSEGQFIPWDKLGTELIIQLLSEPCFPGAPCPAWPPAAQTSPGSW